MKHRSLLGSNLEDFRRVGSNALGYLVLHIYISLKMILIGRAL